MANIIFNNNVDKNLFLQMSNGATSVFICLLSIAASSLAKTTNEIRLATCIASRDQSIFGIGCVGFDISELPWSLELTTFNQEKEFIISAIRNAIAKIGWHKLGYELAADKAIHSQEIFMVMVEKICIQHVRLFEPDNFILPDKLGERCELHEVFLHGYGCVVCNDK